MLRPSPAARGAGGVGATGALTGPLARPLRPRSRRRPARARSGPTDGRKESFESLFERELKKRGVAYDRGARDAPENQGGPIPQLDLSRALNSEGLEGLLPRARELLLLGLSLPLGFLPLALVVALAGGSLYALYGDHFVHGGRPMSLPQYVDAEALLQEPAVDPRVPFGRAREAPGLRDS